MAKSTTWFGKYTKGDKTIFFRLVTPGDDNFLGKYGKHFGSAYTYIPMVKYRSENCEFHFTPAPNVVYTRQFLLKETGDPTVVALYEQEKFAWCTGCNFVILLEQMLVS